jgi:hypothetical protein
MVKEIIWIFVGKGGVDLKLLERRESDYLGLNLKYTQIEHVFLDNCL